MSKIDKNHKLSNYMNTGLEHNPDKGNNHSNFSDPAFSKNKTSPIHRWVPWIAGFSKEFVNDTINHYISGNGTILDPFSGVGTTLIEALISGNDSVGFEINPYAAFACRTKLNAPKIDESKLEREIQNFIHFYKDCLKSKRSLKSEFPEGFKTRVEFYSPKVLRKVLIVQDFIRAIEDSDISDLFKLAFTSTMVKYSNYSYEPSLGTRKGSGKENILDSDVGTIVVSKLDEFLEDIRWIKSQLGELCPSYKIYNDSFFNYEEYLKKGSVDLLVTSPPYLNNYHYNRNTRPQLYWLGFASSPKDMKPLEYLNFGNFWQTVRDSEELELIFDPSFIDLEEQLDELKKINPERKTYGGKGWANYAVAYFNDCFNFANGIKYSLKSDGTALVVIGNSILQGINIPTDYYFGKIAESVGLELVDIHILRSKRIGNSIIQSDVRVAKAKKGHRLYESVVELRQL